MLQHFYTTRMRFFGIGGQKDEEMIVSPKDWSIRAQSAKFTMNAWHREKNDGFDWSNNDYVRVVQHGQDIILAAVADGVGRSKNAFAHAKLSVELLIELLFLTPKSPLKNGCKNLKQEEIQHILRETLKEMNKEFPLRTSGGTLSMESTLAFSLVCLMDGDNFLQPIIFSSGIGDSSVLLYQPTPSLSSSSSLSCSSSSSSSSSCLSSWQYLFVPDSFSIISTSDFYLHVPITTQTINHNSAIVVATDGFTDQFQLDYRARKSSQQVCNLLSLSFILMSSHPLLTLLASSFLDS
jgi:serine/threonine protein phosphatase PrpC